MAGRSEVASGGWCVCLGCDWLGSLRVLALADRGLVPHFQISGRVRLALEMDAPNHSMLAFTQA